MPLQAVDLARALAEPLARQTHPERPFSGRRAAVLMLLYDRDAHAHLLLTKRSARLSAHPGQVSLPGGMREPEDRSLMVTALRETQEEVGIPPERVRIIGRLDDVHTVATDFLVRPFIGLATGPVRPTPASDEVDRVMEVPVDEILDIDRRLPEGLAVATTRYPLDGEDVWGATARMLRLFAAIARGALAERR